MGRFDIAKGVEPKPQVPPKKARGPDIRPDLPQTELYLVRRVDGVIRAIEPITVQDVSFTAASTNVGTQFSVNMTFPLSASQASSLFDNDRRLSQRTNLVDERLRSELRRHLDGSDASGLRGHSQSNPPPDPENFLDSVLDSL